MAPHTKQHGVHRLCSLNLYRQHCCQELITMAAAADADFFAFQEPPSYSTCVPTTPQDPPNSASTTAHTEHIQPQSSYRNQRYTQQLHKLAARANYTVFTTPHTITLIHTHTLLPLLSHAHTPLHNGRLHTFLFVPPTSPPFSITNTYFYQQGFHDPQQAPLLIQSFKSQCHTTKARYPDCSFIILGDINASTHDQSSIPSSRNFLRFATTSLDLQSVLATHCSALREQLMLFYF